MVNGRLFTLGCSHTKWVWPTWADFIGYFFEEFHNYGKGGCGNFFALSHLCEINEKYKLTSEDTILIMLSDDNRADFIQNNGNWTATGNVYAPTNESYFGSSFVNNIWSSENGVNTSWVSILSMKSILENIGCKYRIYTAYDMDEDLHWIKKDKRKIIMDRKLKLIQTKSLLSFKNKDVERYKFWNPDDKEYRYDGHCRLEEHLNWIKSEANEFYNEEMKSLLENWNKKIHPHMLTEDWASVFRNDHKEIVCGVE